MSKHTPAISRKQKYKIKLIIYVFWVPSIIKWNIMFVVNTHVYNDDMVCLIITNKHFWIHESLRIFFKRFDSIVMIAVWLITFSMSCSMLLLLEN